MHRCANVNLRMAIKIDMSITKLEFYNEVNPLCLNPLRCYILKQK